MFNLSQVSKKKTSFSKGFAQSDVSEFVEKRNKPRADHVLNVLNMRLRSCAKIDQTGPYTTITNKQLAKKIGRSVSTVQRAIRDLLDSGKIMIIEFEGTKNGRPFTERRIYILEKSSLKTPILKNLPPWSTLTYSIATNNTYISLNSVTLNNRGSGGDVFCTPDVYNLADSVHNFPFVQGEIIKSEVHEDDKSDPPPPKKPKKEPLKAKISFNKETGKIDYDESVAKKFKEKCPTYEFHIIEIEKGFAERRWDVPLTPRGLLRFVTNWLGKHKGHEMRINKETGKFYPPSPDAFRELHADASEDEVMEAISAIEKWAVQNKAFDANHFSTIKKCIIKQRQFKNNKKQKIQNTIDILSKCSDYLSKFSIKMEITSSKIQLERTDYKENKFYEIDLSYPDDFFKVLMRSLKRFGVSESARNSIMAGEMPKLTEHEQEDIKYHNRLKNQQDTIKSIPIDIKKHQEETRLAEERRYQQKLLDEAKRKEERQAAAIEDMHRIRQMKKDGILKY